MSLLPGPGACWEGEPWACDQGGCCSPGSGPFYQGRLERLGRGSRGEGCFEDCHGKLVLHKADRPQRVRTSELSKIQILTPPSYHPCSNHVVFATASSLLSPLCPHRPQLALGTAHTTRPPARRWASSLTNLWGKTLLIPADLAQPTPP